MDPGFLSTPSEQLSLFDSTLPLRDASRVDELPATALQLIEIIGLDATIDLVRAEGGNDLPIPEVIGGKSRMWQHLVGLIGADAAGKLVERCRGTPVYVPMCAAALRAFRNRDILERFDRGERFDSIRRSYKISRSYLYRLLKKTA
jgi:hypothetical protein